MFFTIKPLIIIIIISKTHNIIRQIEACNTIIIYKFTIIAIGADHMPYESIYKLKDYDSNYIIQINLIN